MSGRTGGRRHSRKREGRRCLQDMFRDLGCGGVGEAMGAALPTFSDHRHSCQQPRWAPMPAKYNSTTHLPPVPVAQRRPTVWKNLHTPFKLSHYTFYAGTDSRLVYIPTVCRDYTSCFSFSWSDVYTGGGADLGIKEARDKDQLAKKPSGEGKRIQTVCLSFPHLEEGHTLCEPGPKLHPS